MTDKVIANIKEKYDSIDDLDGLDELKYIPSIIPVHAFHPSPRFPPFHFAISDFQGRRQEHDQRSH